MSQDKPKIDEEVNAPETAEDAEELLPVAEAASLASEEESSRDESPSTDSGDDLEENKNLENIVMALLFSADEPLGLRKMAAIIEDAPADDIRDAINAWRERMKSEAWSITIEKVAGGYQLASLPDYAPYISRLYSGKRKLRLSKAGLETLAIIAYKQPVTRAEVENVRGVAAGGVISNLMERSLIKITGKAKVLGAPFLYGTTTEFLEYLGLNSLKDLPSLEELEALLERDAYPDKPELETVGSNAGDEEESGQIEEELDDLDEMDMEVAAQIVESVKGGLPKEKKTDDQSATETTGSSDTQATATSSAHETIETSEDEIKKDEGEVAAESGDETEGETPVRRIDTTGTDAEVVTSEEKRG